MPASTSTKPSTWRPSTLTKPTASPATVEVKPSMLSNTESTRTLLPKLLTTLLALATCLGLASAEHHMKRQPTLEARQSVNTVPLTINNQCPSTVWVGVYTTGNDVDLNTGFALDAQQTRAFNVPTHWQGRVWGRTNCTFGSMNSVGGYGEACVTGDCGGVLDCKTPGNPPATLAEFTMNGSDSQTFYDISLVDGYNLPMAIIMDPNGVPALEKINLASTNPSCVASIGDFGPMDWNPYASGQSFLGTTLTNPLPFVKTLTAALVAAWCPWDLQSSMPEGPANGVFRYPDMSVLRPAFDPCVSACYKHRTDEYCCTGEHNLPSTCSASYYSKAAKTVCPDAYSFAFDDTTSTFITPAGGGYEVRFCPGGFSTDILKDTKGKP
ncbi:Osmotin, thaumatin-like protein, partial [Piedraia hortae CBS 480.64]